MLVASQAGGEAVLRNGTAAMGSTITLDLATVKELARTPDAKPRQLYTAAGRWLPAQPGYAAQQGHVVLCADPRAAAVGAVIAVVCSKCFGNPRTVRTRLLTAALVDYGALEGRGGLLLK